MLALTTFILSIIFYIFIAYFTRNNVVLRSYITIITYLVFITIIIVQVKKDPITFGFEVILLYSINFLSNRSENQYAIIISYALTFILGTVKDFILHPFTSAKNLATLFNT